MARGRNPGALPGEPRALAARESTDADCSRSWPRSFGAGGGHGSGSGWPLPEVTLREGELRRTVALTSGLCCRRSSTSCAACLGTSRRNGSVSMRRDSRAPMEAVSRPTAFGSRPAAACSARSGRSATGQAVSRTARRPVSWPQPRSGGPGHSCTIAWPPRPGPPITQQSDELKSALLQSVSHDLRTPLATIRAAAGTLRQGSGLRPDDQAESVDAIDREVEYLNPWSPTCST